MQIENWMESTWGIVHQKAHRARDGRHTEKIVKTTCLSNVLRALREWTRVNSPKKILENKHNTKTRCLLSSSEQYRPVSVWLRKGRTVTRALCSLSSALRAFGTSFNTEVGPRVLNVILYSSFECLFTFIRRMHEGISQKNAIFHRRFSASTSTNYARHSSQNRVECLLHRRRID